MSAHTTMADVARKAGVSIMTVSRVVNNKEGVSRETRQRIQEIIRRLDYRPSGIARSLATRRTGTLGLIVPDISNPFFSSVARGVEKIAYAEGYSLLLCNSDEDPQRESDVLQLLEEKRVDGVLLCSSRMEGPKLRKMLGRHPAAVLVNRAIENGKLEFKSAMVDDTAGGKLATRHLLSRGHKIIAFLSGPPNSYSGQGRRRGYRAALDAAGIPFDPKLTPACAPTVEGGYAAAKNLLQNHPEISALYCYNDLVAVGALQACAESGRAVPQDLAIVGSDDIPLAALVTPALTTCRVSQEELGEQAVKMLLDQIRGDDTETSQWMLAPKLVIRASAP